MMIIRLKRFDCHVQQKMCTKCSSSEKYFLFLWVILWFRNSLFLIRNSPKVEFTKKSADIVDIQMQFDVLRDKLASYIFTFYQVFSNSFFTECSLLHRLENALHCEYWPRFSPEDQRYCGLYLLSKITFQVSSTESSQCQKQYLLLISVVLPLVPSPLSITRSVSEMIFLLFDSSMKTHEKLRYGQRK